MGSQGINEVLKQFSDLATPYAQSMFEVIVRQKILHGWVWLFVAIIYITGTLFIASKRYNKVQVDDFIDFYPFLLSFFISLILFAVMAIQAILQILNPEFYAIQFLLGR